MSLDFLKSLDFIIQHECWEGTRMTSVVPSRTKSLMLNWMLCIWMVSLHLHSHSRKYENVVASNSQCQDTNMTTKSKYLRNIFGMRRNLWCFTYFSISCTLLDTLSTFGKLLTSIVLKRNRDDYGKKSMGSISRMLILESLPKQRSVSLLFFPSPSYTILPKSVALSFQQGKGETYHTNRSLLQTAINQSIHCVLSGGRWTTGAIVGPFQPITSFVSHCSPWVWINTIFSYVNPSLPMKEDLGVRQYSHVTR